MDQSKFKNHHCCLVFPSV